MTRLTGGWLDPFGWGGGALLIPSLLQIGALRLRALNAIACVVLIIVNGCRSESGVRVLDATA